MLDVLCLEIIYEILFYLSYSDIINYCHVCTKFKTLYSDITFWLRLLDRDFSIVGQNKPSTYANKESGRYMYDRWEYITSRYINFQFIELHPSKLHQDLIPVTKCDPKYLIKDKYSQHEHDINSFQIYINDDVIYYYLITNAYPSWVDLKNILGAAIKYNKIHIIEYLVHNQIKPYDGDMSNILIHGNLSLLQYFINHNIFPKCYDIKALLIKPDYKILYWLLEQNICFTAIEYVLTDAMRTIAPQTLSILEEYGVLPNIQGANQTVKHSNLLALEWILQRDIHPDIFVSALETCNLDIIHMLKQAGILKDHNLYYYAVQHNSINLIKYLNNNGVIPHQNIVNMAALYHNLDMLIFFEKLNFIPNFTGKPGDIIKLIRDGALDILKWLLDHKILAAQYGTGMSIERVKNSVLSGDYIVNIATICSNTKVLQYFEKLGFKPDQTYIKQLIHNSGPAVLDLLGCIVW